MTSYWLIFDRSFGGGDPPEPIKDAVYRFDAANDDDARERVREFIGVNTGKVAVALREPQFREVSLN
jgi:hypothetical protein